MSGVIEYNTDAIGELPDAEPLPVRYWWLKRLLILGGAFLLLLVAVRLCWGWEAHRRFQAEIDKCVAAGEPIYPQDFNPEEPIPDDRNAAKSLMDAAAAIALTPDQKQLVTDVINRRVDAGAHLDDLKRTVGANAAALALAREARSRPDVDWGIRIVSPAMNTLLPHLSGQRELNRAIVVSAAYFHAAGDDEAAMETLSDAWAQADAIETDSILICHLTAIRCRSLTLRCVEALLPTLATPSRGDGSPTDRQATDVRERLQRLIGTLLEEADSKFAFRNAMFGERMLQLDVVRSVIDRKFSLSSLMSWPPAPPTIGESILLALYSPTLTLEGVSLMRGMARFVHASQAGNWPEAMSRLLDEPNELQDRSAIIRPLTGFLAYSLENAAERHFRHFAERRMAAVAIAMRLYEVDHGRRPETLSQLVPGYLEAIPADPFADDGRPIAYAPDAEPPVLYSIGSDGVDDGGAFKLRGGGIDYDVLDVPFFLNGDRPGREP